MDIIWHRQDIRCSDNKAVSKSDDAIPVYIFDPNIIEKASSRRLKWVIENVKKLRKDYRKRNSDLCIRIGDPATVLLDLIDRKNVNNIVWNKSYSKIGRSRDKKVRNKIKDYVKCNSYQDKMLHGPNEIFTNKGDPYSVFTYYHRKWKKRDKSDPYEAPDDSQLHNFEDKNEVPELTDFDFEEPKLDYPESGTHKAKEKLKTFCESDIEKYEERRDYPSDRKTSGLSPYMAYGVIGVREVWSKTEDAKDVLDNTDSIESFQEQLAWRDFYTQVLYHNPNVVTKNYKNYENDIDWSYKTEHIRKWKEGKTGYPIVDAGMRELIKKGTMHNRLRMIVASFLTKDLQVDWRVGYKWFRKMLIDHDTANNNGGWQWAASTGTDSQPYFRIFNPMTQGEKYDPDAEYIRKYVPELSNVRTNKIHNWNELDDKERNSLCSSYYHPIVQHSKMRDKAIEMFKKARDE